ncbi:MAG: hypothetical protein R2873_17700 [Caldilineaceae bacterium]
MPPVIDWLLDGDPAIRWQVMQDLLGAPAEDDRRQRARVAREGWEARTSSPSRTPTGAGAVQPERLDVDDARPHALRDFGLDPASEAVQRAVGLVREQVMERLRPARCNDSPFFAGELEPASTDGWRGKRLAGQDISGIVDRLLSEQLTDGGWNCRPRTGAARSFNTDLRAGSAARARTQHRQWSRSHRGAPCADRNTCSPASLPARKRRTHHLRPPRPALLGQHAPPSPFRLPPWWHYDACCAAWNAPAPHRHHPRRAWTKRSRWCCPAANRSLAARSPLPGRNAAGN